MSRPLHFSLYTVLLFNWSIANAQLISLSAGETVRVYTYQDSARFMIGTLSGIDLTSVTIQNRKSYRTFMNESILRLDVSNGRTKKTGRGFLIGAAAGIAVGGLFGAATWSECRGTGYSCMFHPDSRGASAQFGAITGGVIGSAMGAFVGSRTIDYHWQTLYHIESTSTAPPPNAAHYSPEPAVARFR